MRKFLITDDHAIIRKGLRQLLHEAYPSAGIDEAVNAESAIKLALGKKFDVIICDLSMPGGSGLDVLQHVRQHSPETPVLILSIHPEEQYAIRTLKAGAAGYLSKDAATDELVNAVQRVLQGRKYIPASVAEKMARLLDKDASDKPLHETLSDREFLIFRLLAIGKTLKEIGTELSLSRTTVSTFKSRVMKKMNMKTNAEIARYAIGNQLISQVL